MRGLLPGDVVYYSHAARAANSIPVRVLAVYASGDSVSVRSAGGTPEALSRTGQRMYTDADGRAVYLSGALRCYGCDGTETECAPFRFLSLGETGGVPHGPCEDIGYENLPPL